MEVPFFRFIGLNMAAIHATEIDYLSGVNLIPLRAAD
jgi:hypothetical protein